MVPSNEPRIDWEEKPHNKATRKQMENVWSKRIALKFVEWKEKDKLYIPPSPSYVGWGKKEPKKDYLGILLMLFNNVRLTEKDSILFEQDICREVERRDFARLS